MVGTLPSRPWRRGARLPLPVASHSGSEMTITVEIARYTATDAIVEGFALTVRMTAGSTYYPALFEQ